MRGSVWIEERKTRRGKAHLVRWEYYVPGPGGKPVRRRGGKSFGPFKDLAQTERATRLREMYTGQLSSRARQAKNLSAAINDYLKDAATYKSPRTVEGFDRPALMLLLEYATDRPLGDFSGDAAGVELVRGWKTWLFDRKHSRGGTYNAYTVSALMRAARTFLNYWKISPNPFEDVKLPKGAEVGVVLTDDQVRKVPGILSGMTARAFMFGFFTGLRRGELVGLEWADVRRTGRGVEMTLRRTKTGNTRIVELDAWAVSCLPPRRPAGQVFEGVSVTVIKNYSPVVAKGLGVKRFRFHDVRHNWATRAARVLDLDSWMRAGGWKSVASARGYLHYFQAAREGELTLHYGFERPPWTTDPHFLPT